MKIILNLPAKSLILEQESFSTQTSGVWNPCVKNPRQKRQICGKYISFDVLKMKLCSKRTAGAPVNILVRS